MEVKLFEIRDRGTFIPAMAIKLGPSVPHMHEDEQFVAEMFLLRRAGYNEEQLTGLSSKLEWELRCPRCLYTMAQSVAEAVLATQGAELICDSTAHPSERVKMEKYPSKHHLPSELPPYIIVVKLDGVDAEYDPHSWEYGGRTIPSAHQYIIDHWKELKSGQVLDVEFLNGESAEPKITERLEHE